MLIYLISAGQRILVNTWCVHIKGFFCEFGFLCLNLFLSTECSNYYGLNLFFHRKKTLFMTNLQYHHLKREEKRRGSDMMRENKINTLIQKIQNYNFHKQTALFETYSKFCHSGASSEHSCPTLTAYKPWHIRKHPYYIYIKAFLSSCWTFSFQQQRTQIQCTQPLLSK